MEPSHLIVMAERLFKPSGDAQGLLQNFCKIFVLEFACGASGVSLPSLWGAI